MNTTSEDTIGKVLVFGLWLLGTLALTFKPSSSESDTDWIRTH